MALEETGFYAAGPNAWSRLRSSLEAAGIDPEDVREMTVYLRHEENGTEARVGDLIDAADEPEEDDGSEPEEDDGPDQVACPDCGRVLDATGKDPSRVLSGHKRHCDKRDIEKGPIPPEERGERRGASSSGGAYEGDYPPVEGTVRPDSNRGAVLRAVDEIGGWARPRQVEDAADMDRHTASRALSGLFVDNGYVDRRKADPQPSGKGVQREYRLSKEGRAALAKSKREFPEGWPDE